jgi:hypothetical protein
MEPKALDGARETISRCRPIIQAEHHICGWNTIKLHVGDEYEFLPAGINVVCVPKGDPVLEMFEQPNETPRILLSPD